jgi:hypothetical protein
LGGETRSPPLVGQGGRTAVRVRGWPWADLGEEGSGHEVLILQEGDALAAVELLCQVCHVRLQLSKTWRAGGRL